MEPIFVSGHRNPDTDSIVAAMAYAALQNALGNREYMAMRLGPVNDETQSVLDRFGFEAPQYIANVRTQVRDLEYDTPPILSAELTINAAWSVFEKDTALSSLPVADENGMLKGVITRGDIAAYDMDTLRQLRIDDVPIFNVLAALEGNVVNNPSHPVDMLSGDIVISLPRTHDNHFGITPRLHRLRRQPARRFPGSAEGAGILHHSMPGGIHPGTPGFESRHVNYLYAAERLSGRAHDAPIAFHQPDIEPRQVNYLPTGRLCGRCA